MPLHQPRKVPLLRSSGPQVRDDMVFLRGEKKVQSGKSAAAGVYWLIVTLSEPLEHVPDEVMDALTVVAPVASNVASPGVEENVSSEVSPDVQVALLVTLLLLLSIAVN